MITESHFVSWPVNIVKAGKPKCRLLSQGTSIAEWVRTQTAPKRFEPKPADWPSRLRSMKVGRPCTHSIPLDFFCRLPAGADDFAKPQRALSRYDRYVDDARAGFDPFFRPPRSDIPEGQGTTMQSQRGSMRRSSNVMSRCWAS